jgi:hypothetical protein
MTLIHEVKRQGKYRSKLEKYCAEYLSKKGVKFAYEKHKVVLLPKFRYEGISLEKVGKTFKQQRHGQAAITYTPDFTDPKMSKWVIECKGFFTPQARIKWKMYKKYLLDNNIEVDLFMPTNQRQVRQCVNYIADRYNERNFRIN